VHFRILGYCGQFLPSPCPHSQAAVLGRILRDTYSRDAEFGLAARGYSLLTFCCSRVFTACVVLIPIHPGAAFGTMVLKLHKGALTVAGSLATAQRSEERMLPSVALGGTPQHREYTPK